MHAQYDAHSHTLESDFSAGCERKETSGRTEGTMSLLTFT